MTDFGANPGALKMFCYLPPGLPKGSPLVVVLHGCGQNAAGYDHGAGWSTLAKRYGFALLMPEQQSVNNANTCFNWFNPEDIARDRGEAASIRQMIAEMVADHHIDRRRIYVTGLSAGGAMTSVMLATYPDVFAAGAVIAGLPYGIAGNVREALERMMQSQSRPATELGDLVRNASRHKGPWPRLSVWHGSADPPSIPPMRMRSSSNGSTCTACPKRRWRKPLSTAIRARSGGMPTARRWWSPTPSRAWRMARRSASPTMTSAMAWKARS